MNIGDKVRLLHGTEEGIIRRIIDNRTVEIEIEDGFLIPVLSKEIVLISSDENPEPTSKDIYTPIEIKDSNNEEDKHQEGIFLGITTKQNISSGWVINNTKDIILFAVYEKNVDGVVGLSHGVLNDYTYAKITDWKLGVPHGLPTIIIDLIKFKSRIEDHNEPYTRKIDLQSYSSGQETRLPMLGSSGILIALNDQMTVPDPEVLKEALFTGEPEVRRKDLIKKKSIQEVDLHIEVLVDDSQLLDSENILNIQLSEFNTCLENAVINGADQIIFIHGVGNGILRNKIHKKLSQYPHTKYFEDARKEKFGYGATKVHLK
jgi:hypothetical protein